MLKISPAVFAISCGLSIPSPNTSVSQLIDSLTDDQARRVSGYLIYKFGQIECAYADPKDAVREYVARIHSCLKQLEVNIIYLSLHYCGIDWEGDSRENWWWQPKHDDIVRLLGMGRVNTSWVSRYSALQMVSSRVDSAYRNLLETAIIECSDDLVLSGDTNNINDASTFLIRLLTGVPENKFLEGVLASLLLRGREGFQISVTGQALDGVKRLLAAIVSNNKEDVQRVLIELNNSFGSRPLIPSAEIGRLQVNFADRWSDPWGAVGNFGTEWWREQM